MGGGDEPGFTAIRFAHDAHIDQEAGHGVIEGVIAKLPVAISGRRFGAEEQARHAVMAGEAVGNAALRQHLVHALLHRLAKGCRAGQGIGVLEDGQGRFGCSEAHRLGGIGATMGNALAVFAQDLFLAADRRDRIAVGDRLGDGEDIGLDAIELLGAALADAEAGLHFVDDHQHAIFGAKLTHRLDEFRLRGNTTAIAEDRLDQHGGNGVVVLFENFFEAIGVVIWHLPEQLTDSLGNALAIGDDLRVLALVLHGLRISGPHGGVEQAVIGAFEGDIIVFAGIAAGEAQRSHYRFGAGIGETHQLSRGHHFLDQLGNCDFLLGAEREDGTDRLRLAGGSIHVRMAVAENGRTIAEAIIDIFVAINIPEAGALAVFHEHGLLFAPITEIRAHPERHVLHRLLVMCARFRQVAALGFDRCHDE